MHKLYDSLWKVILNVKSNIKKVISYAQLNIINFVWLVKDDHIWKFVIYTEKTKTHKTNIYMFYHNLKMECDNFFSWLVNQEF